VIFFATSILLILAAGVAALAFPHERGWAERWFRILLSAGCTIGLAVAVAVLAGSGISDARLPVTVPGGAWVFGIDALSALFLVAVFGVGVASGLYGVSYLAHDRGHRSVALAHFLVALVVASLALVVTARAVVPFLMSWEVMAIAAYLLIVYERERAQVRKAGILYIVSTHACTLALFALFAIWSGNQDLTFATLAERAPLLASSGILAMTFALFAFGLKAGVVPFHFWLPAAHAAAPSHVSALMSGVVIKMGIYGLMRAIVLLGTPPAWLGWLLLSLGAASGILGVVWALAQHDIKRLLAYHSVENIGIILMGLGAGVLGTAHRHPLVATLGFAGAALHTLNHALFKSLLFLGAGSVLHATGIRTIDRLGGLARRMPRTTFAFLLGAAAIVGLPPLNGFVSEWLVFRSLLSAGASADTSRLAIIAVVMLALIGALALACFAKVVGVIYLGNARDAAAEQAHESSTGIVAPMFGLAAACVVIGLLPVLALPPMFRVAALLAGEPSIAAHDTSAATLTSLNGFLVLALIAGWILAALAARTRTRLSAPTWGCGYAEATAKMQYTASSFASPILLAFGPVAGVHATRTAQTFATHAVDPVMDGIVLRLWRVIRRLAQRARPMQRGRLSLYLLYIVATVLALLLYLVLAGSP
jgi:formate hydrogenlyase subunit 3/multisubunit Na+/H+ antiporter MnhD subunit